MIRMNDVLGNTSRDNKMSYLMGDFNLNLLNNQNHNAAGEFLDGLYSHLFFPLITLPSRITSHTATLIDNIFSNHAEHSYLRSGLLITDISDHLLIFSVSLDHMLTHQRQESLFVRDKSERNISSFLEELDYILTGLTSTGIMILKSTIVNFSSDTLKLTKNISL